MIRRVLLSVATVLMLSGLVAAVGPAAQAADVPDSPGTPIPVGIEPFGVAVTPDGTTAYVTNWDDDTVTPIVLPANIPGTPIPVGGAPANIAITPDGTTAYVTNYDDDNVTPITLATIDSTPPNKDACKKGGWESYTDQEGTPFKNQGDCVSYVATGGTNLADG